MKHDPIVHLIIAAVVAWAVTWPLVGGDFLSAAMNWILFEFGVQIWKRH